MAAGSGFVVYRKQAQAAELEAMDAVTREAFDRNSGFKGIAAERYEQAVNGTRGAKIIVDLGYADSMTPQERTHLIVQLCCCGGANALAQQPCDLRFAPLGQVHEEAVRKRNADRWKFVRWQQEVLPPASSPGHADGAPRLVYLCEDAGEVLQEMRRDDIYLIPGLRSRGGARKQCKLRAEQLGARAVRLPIREHVPIAAGHALSANTMLELLLLLLERPGQWAWACNVALPQRVQVPKELRRWEAFLSTLAPTHTLFPLQRCSRRLDVHWGALKLELHSKLDTERTARPVAPYHGRKEAQLEWMLSHVLPLLQAASRRCGGDSGSTRTPGPLAACFCMEGICTWTRQGEPGAVEGARVCINASTDGCRAAAHVLEVGAGRGDLSLLLARELPWCSVTAIDTNLPSLRQGQALAREMGLGNVRFTHCSVLEVPDSQPVDMVIALHACGGLSDAALALAARRQVPFLLCTCCFTKHRPLAWQAGADWSKELAACTPCIPAGQQVGGESQKFAESDEVLRTTAVAPVLNAVDGNNGPLHASVADDGTQRQQQRKANMLCSIADCTDEAHRDTAARAMHLINSMRLAKATRRHGSHSVEFRLLEFPADFSPMNQVLVGWPIVRDASRGGGS